MKILWSIWVLVMSIFALSACGNAINFYQYDRFSLTLSVRTTDPSQPVQGNLGMKQKVAMVNPPKGNGDGESLSLISSYRYNKSPGEPLEIYTAFITGDAASGLDETQAQEAASAISHRSRYVNTSTSKILKNFVRPDGQERSPENDAKIRKWLSDNGFESGPGTVTMFINAEKMEDGQDAEEARMKAVRDLGLDSN